jgi:glycosyltransferase involved in cell wall biosynthesis
MSNNAKRVLFVTPVAFNPHTGGGATFSSLFRGWPKDCLATIHNDPNPTPDDVCEKYFTLGRGELDLIPPLNIFRRRDVFHQPQATPVHTNRAIDQRPTLSLWKNRVRQVIFGDSLPERARLTPALERWITDYQPQVLYTILGSNGMMSLIEQIRDRFQLPLVVHIMDDWASAAHRTGLFAPIERWRLQRNLRRFFAVAHTRLGISPAMCQTYTQRYGRPFIPFQYALDTAQWLPFSKRDLTPCAPPEFLYIGSIFPNAQLQSLTDCAQAIAQLNNEGFTSRLRIITSAENCARYRHRLELHPNIQMTPSFGDEAAFFTILGKADALLLPVNFDPASVDFIRYSMPTKIPAYLISGTPVLVYGPAETAQVRYALESGWGHVIAERSPSDLKAALRRIIEDGMLRSGLSEAARKAAANHDAKTVRGAFQDLLCRVEKSHP